MRILAFGRQSAETVVDDVAVSAAISRIARIDGRTQVTALHLGPNGRYGSGPTPVNRLMLVVAGGGEVSDGQAAPVAITPGRAAYWTAGEHHHTTSPEGLIAVILESPALNP